jgi:Domain of unknown function (DUF4114)/PEP-CTERM motif
MSIINSNGLKQLIAFGFITAGTLSFNVGKASADACDGDTTYSGGGTIEASLDDLVNNPDCGFRVSGPDIADSGSETYSTDFFKAMFALEFEIAGDAEKTVFGVYDVASGLKKALFGAADDPIADIGWTPGENKITQNTANLFAGFGSTFGFYLTNKRTSQTYYSQSILNPVGEDMAKIFEGDDESVFDLQLDGAAPTHKFHPGDLIIAFEDRHTGLPYADADHNDTVVYMHRKESVPEPATLLGLGLVAGAFGLIRQRDRNS